MIFLYILLIVLAAVIALLAAACVHAAVIKNRTPRDAVPPVDKEKAEKYAGDLSRMIQCNTVNGRELDKNEVDAKFAGYRAVLEKLFPLTHRRLSRTLIGNAMLMKWEGADPSRGAVVLVGHSDVVPAAGEWEHPPFGGEIAEGRVWGRGAMDNKGSLCAIFEAVETLLAEGFVPPCDVYIASSCNEELMGDGAPDTVDTLTKQGVKLDLVIDEGGAVVQSPMPGLSGNYAMIGITEKGYGDVKFTARSNGGHSSTPPKGTPLARLAAFVDEVEHKPPFRKKITEPVRRMFEALAPDMAFPYRLIFGNLWLFAPLLKILLPKISAQAGALLRTTCAFTMTQGSGAPNVIPESASVTANLRFSMHQPRDESLAALKKVAERHGLEMEVLYAGDCSPVVDTGSEQYQFVRRCIRETFPEAGIAPYMMLGCTDARHYAKVCQNAIRFGPTVLSPEQLAGMHARNENLNVDALARAVDFYRCVLKNYE